MSRRAACTLAVIMAASTPFALENGLARTPPMGWNSWNWFGCGDKGHGQLDDALIRGIADAMVSSGMRDVGYRYVNIDDCWAESNRDPRGGLVPSKTRFPNFRDLVAYVHSKGLYIGVYSDVADRTCAGTMPGALGHEQQDADTLVAWGVDYLKHDFCGGSNPVYAYTKMRDCLRTAVTKARNTGNTSAHDIVFSICNWGLESPWLWGDTIGNLWRTTDDIDCELGSAIDHVSRQIGLEKYAGPGGWNDPDMMEIGNSCMTTGEERIHLSIFCIVAAPLIVGNDPRNMTANTRAVLTNKEVIAVDQDSLGIQGKRIKTAYSDEVQTWAKPLKNGEIAVAFMNLWRSTATDMSVTWAELASGLGIAVSSTKTFQVRDLWNHQNLAPATGSFTARAVPPGDVTMIRLSDGSTKTLGGLAHAPIPQCAITRKKWAVSVEFLEPGRAVVTILDAKGAVVRSLLRSDGQRVMDIDTRDMRPGMYVVRIHAGNAALAQKLPLW